MYRVATLADRFIAPSKILGFDSKTGLGFEELDLIVGLRNRKVNGEMEG